MTPTRAPGLFHRCRVVQRGGGLRRLTGAVTAKRIEAGVFPDAVRECEFRRAFGAAPLQRQHGAHRNPPAHELIAEPLGLLAAGLVKIALCAAVTELEVGGVTHSWRIGMAHQQDRALSKGCAM